MRTAIKDFALANRLYAGASVTFYTVSGGAKTATKATLYAASTGSATLGNPQVLGSDGKLRQAVYLEVPTIATITGLTVASHDTGIISPAPTFRINPTTFLLEFSYDGGSTYQASTTTLFKYRGTWATATAYAPTDVINYGGTLYCAVAAHTSAATLLADVAAAKVVPLALLSLSLAAGADPTGTDDSASAITTSLAQAAYVLMPPGTYKNTAGLTVASGKTLELTPGAAFSGIGTVTKAAGSSVISRTEGASADCWYYGRKFTGARTVGAGVLEGYTPYSYMFDVRSDDSDVGGSFAVGVGARYYFGGSATKGGRQALNASLWFTAATHASNLNRNYVGAQTDVHVQAGDGGTNTGAGALGAFFGSGAAMYMEAAATNLYGAVGQEINTFTQSGSTTARLTALSITGCNFARGASVDAAISVSAQAASAGYGPHAGWGYGLLFTDDNGAFPFTNTSTIIGGQFTTAQAVQDGINFSSFTFTGQILKGAYLAINESSMSLGDSGGNASIIVAGASTNGNLVLSPKGTGVVSTGTNGWAVSGTKVVGARDTGWSAMTGSTNKATVYDTATVTLAQLAGRVMALQAALTTHGLIGA